MKIIIYLCLLCASTGVLFAQKNVEVLLKNPDIIWAAEIYADFNPDKTYTELKAVGLVGQSDFIKLLAKPYKGVELYPMMEGEAHRFVAKIFNADFINKSNLYQDKTLSQLLSPKEKEYILTSVDTIITKNPTTGDEKKQVVTNLFDPNSISFYRIKQVCYYNKKDTMFYVVPVALAPLVEVVDDKGTRLRFTPMFWIPLGEETKTDLAKSSNTWIKRCGYNFSLVENATVLKSTQDLPNSVTSFFNTIGATNKKALVYDVTDGLGGDLLKDDVLQEIQKMTGDDITQLRVYQDWIWDEKEQKLSFRFLGFSVIVNRYNNKGEIQSSGPLLHRRAKDLK